MRIILVKPQPGFIVPMPDGRDLPDDGVLVDADDLFWTRRLNDGDVVEVQQDAPKAPTKKDSQQ